ARQGLARRERQRMHEEVQVTDLLAKAVHQRGDLLVAGDVALEQEGIAERRRQLAQVVPEPLALVGQGEPGALAIRGGGDAPRDRPLARHAHDEAGLALEDPRGRLTVIRLSCAGHRWGSAVSPAY